MPDPNPLLTIASLLAAGAALQWIAWRLKVPAILFLLLAGFAAGPLLGERTNTAVPPLEPPPPPRPSIVTAQGVPPPE